MLVEVDLYHKKPATVPLAIREKLLMLKGDVGIGLVLATIPPISKLNMVYCLLHH